MSSGDAAGWKTELLGVLGILGQQEGQGSDNSTDKA